VYLPVASNIAIVTLPHNDSKNGRDATIECQ
jgi:hypothetical protein